MHPNSPPYSTLPDTPEAQQLQHLRQFPPSPKSSKSASSPPSSTPEPSLLFLPNGPISLSSAEYIFFLVETYRENGFPEDGSSWLEFPLSNSEYSELQQKVADSSTIVISFWENKLKYDFFSAESTFAIRMPRPKHERTREEIISSIITQLKKILETTPYAVVKEFIEAIAPTGSSDFKPLLSSVVANNKHQPDGSIRHSAALFASVMVEVANSQDGKDLADLADVYILGSKSEVRLVIGVKLEYRAANDHRVSGGILSTWTPNGWTPGGEGVLMIEKAIDKQPFRSPRGKRINPGGELRIPVLSFCPPWLHPKDWPPNVPDVVITNADLDTYVSKAEIQEQEEAVKTAAAEAVICPARKRKRTPDGSDLVEYPESEGSLDSEDCHKNKKRITPMSSSSNVSPPHMQLRSASRGA